MDIPLMPGEDGSKLTALLTKLTDSESPSHEATDDGRDLSEFLAFADSAGAVVSWACVQTPRLSCAAVRC